MGRRRRADDGPETEVVYGRNPVRELLRAGRRTVVEVHALDGVAGEDWLVAAQVTATPSTRDQLSRLAGSPDHQGIVARAQPFAYGTLRDVVAASGPVVCLDGAHDPRNIGAVARVVDAAGGGGLVIPARGGPAVTPVVCKASAGAVEHLIVVRAESVTGALSELRSGGRTVVGADAEAGVDYRELAIPSDAALVVGAEGVGLRPKVRRSCDQLVSIPMRGSVGSLNLSVATGILLYSLSPNPG